MISVIIPTYNCFKLLNDCLNSIIGQTFTDKEVIILDSLSDDGTVQLIKEYAARFPYIKFVSEKDLGIYDAMNKGIAMAAGQWILFLGSDDRLYKNTILEDVFAVTENSLPDILYGNVYSTRFNGKYDGIFTAEKLFVQNICHQAIFFKKRVFEIVGKFNLSYKMQADWEHNIRWFFNKRVRHQYIDYIISDYGDGGRSSMLGDDAFMHDKPGIFIKHAYFYIGRKLRMQILNTLICAPQVTFFDRMFYQLLYQLNNLKR